jgi:N-acetylneuraminic acid mutarotase
MDVDAMLAALEAELRAVLNRAVMGFVSTARTRLEDAVAEVGNERAKALTEVATERITALAEVDTRRGELSREIEMMHIHQEKQEGCVELNIGGYRFQTSVQTLRRVPHTFFDAYFSGRYAQDVCRDGSIFVDRDGEHFGHVLEYMRDGVVSVAEPSARSSVSLLRALKREFGFYCIELVAEEAVEPWHPEMTYILGGRHDGRVADGMEQYNVSLGQWKLGIPMGTRRSVFGACVLAGEIYVTGGSGVVDTVLSSVEKYSPSSETWSAVAPMPAGRSYHVAVAVGSAIYVLGGMVADEGDSEDYNPTASVVKFHSTQGTWSQVAPLPEPRDSTAACVVGSDIYVFGGEDSSGNAETSVFKFKTEINEWSTTLTPMPVASSYHGACALGGLVYIVGAGADHRQVLCFDPSAGVWRELASTSFSVNGGASFVMAESLHAVSLQEVELYDVAADTWTAVPNLIEERSMFCAVTIGSAGPKEEQDLFDSLIAKAIRHLP